MTENKSKSGVDQ